MLAESSDKHPVTIRMPLDVWVKILFVFGFGALIQVGYFSWKMGQYTQRLDLSIASLDQKHQDLESQIKKLADEQQADKERIQSLKDNISQSLIQISGALGEIKGKLGAK
jgi:hypothetical protein